MTDLSDMPWNAPLTEGEARGPAVDPTQRKFSKIEGFLARGWDLTVTTLDGGKFWATVHLSSRHGPDSYHSIADSLAEVIAKLERYLDMPEDPR